MNTQDYERFMSKVTKLPQIAIDEDPCWLFTKSINGNGYGSLNIVGQGVQGVHRLMWEHVNGSIPVGMQVLHKCDRRNCAIEKSLKSLVLVVEPFPLFTKVEVGFTLKELQSF